MSLIADENISFGVSSFTFGAGTTHNWFPIGGFQPALHIALTGNHTITGRLPGAIGYAQIMIIALQAGGFTLTLPGEDAGSTAAWRWFSSQVLTGTITVLYQYNHYIARWERMN